MADTPVAAPKKKKRSISADLTSHYGGEVTAKAQASKDVLVTQQSQQQASYDALQQGGYDADDEKSFSKFNKDANAAQAGLRDTASGINAQNAILANPMSQVNERTKDIVAGSKFGETVLGEEGLGRSTDSADVTQAMDQLREQSKGFSGAESLARREQAVGNLNQANQGQQRALQAQLARAGVRGGQAGAQVRDTAIAGLQQRGNLERDLFLQGEQASRTGTQAFAQAAGEQSKFDLGQAAKEKNIVLQSGLGFAQLGAAERGAAIQAEATKAAAASQAAASGGGGMSVVCTELHRQGILSDDMYKVNTQFGINLIKESPFTFDAYLTWGVPTAKLMKKSKLATKILAPVMMKWISYINGDKSLSNAIIFHPLMTYTKVVGSILKAFSSKKVRV